MHPELTWLVGKRIETVETIGTQWIFRMTDRACLSVACPWQIIVGGRFSFASGDHEQRYGLAAPIDLAAQSTNLLANRRITNIVSDPITSDLAIHLEGDVLIRTFNDSTGYEGWELTGAEGRQIICQGGGTMVVFPCTGSEYIRRADAKGYLKVLEVLRKWDPIGVISEGNQDEYDSYAPEIARMLDKGVDAGDLAKHMIKIVTECMEIRADKRKARSCARELVDFWRDWKGMN